MIDPMTFNIMLGHEATRLIQSYDPKWFIQKMNTKLYTIDLKQDISIMGLDQQFQFTVCGYDQGHLLISFGVDIEEAHVALSLARPHVVLLDTYKKYLFCLSQHEAQKYLHYTTDNPLTETKFNQVIKILKTFKK